MDEILMSSKELQSRRVNNHSQRHLDNIVRQLEQEKDIVRRDWNHRMKSLLAEKRKVMPKGWDPFRTQRPKSAWQATTRDTSQCTASRPCSAVSVPVMEKIPDHWVLQASYRTAPSGERIPIPVTKTTATRQRTCASAIVRSNRSRSPSSRSPSARPLHLMPPGVSRRPFSAPAKSTSKQMKCNGDINGSFNVRTNMCLIQTPSRHTSDKKTKQQVSYGKVSEKCAKETFNSLCYHDKTKCTNHESVSLYNDKNVSANGKYDQVINNSRKKPTWEDDRNSITSGQNTSNNGTVLCGKLSVNRPQSAGNYSKKTTSRTGLGTGKAKVDFTTSMESFSLLKQVVETH